MSEVQSDTLNRKLRNLPKKGQSGGKAVEKDESFYRAGQWQLVWWKFRRHKLAQIAMVTLGILYFIALFAEFVSPYDPQTRYKDYSAMAPSNVHIRDANGSFHLPFVYALDPRPRPGDVATNLHRGYLSAFPDWIVCGRRGI